jgi:hypothetical protein
VRALERLLILCVAVGGLVYGERLAHTAVSMLARIDPANVHGVIVSGSALGFTQAAIATAVILFGVVPAFLSLFDGRRRAVGLLVGELVAALLLLGASQRVLHASVHARIVGTGAARVLAVRAAATMEAVE